VARVYGAKDGLPPFTIWGLLESADGVLWVSTAGGLARFEGERFDTYRLHARERCRTARSWRMRRATSGQARTPQ
jgi:ligand-binding sensor domain-containing protein